MSDKNEHAKANAAAWWDEIERMIVAFDAAETDDEREAADREIQESILDVCVRVGWHSVGAEIVGNPEEYYILLTTGGPALRIYGGFDRYSEPDLDPILQWQDWGTPWTDWWPADSNDIPYKDTLRRFASQFYFGE